MKTVCITCQKGGVGKTSTCLGLGLGLKRKGYRVLFVDLDAQINLSYVLKADLTKPNVFQALGNMCKPDQAIQTIDGFDIMPGSQMMVAIESMLTDTGKEFRLREILEGLQDKYDYCVIDTAPSLNVLTVNALTASDSCIIPVQADTFSLQGIAQLASTIASVRKYTNRQLTIEGVVITRYQARATLNRTIAEMISKTAQELGTKTYETRVRECVSVREAQALREDIFTYAPKSNATEDYKKLVEEFLKG